MKIRVTIRAKRVTYHTGVIELDDSQGLAERLRNDPNAAEVWMRYTVAPMIRDWKSPPTLATTMGIQGEVMEAKWEEVP